MGVKKHKLELAIDEDFCLLGVVTDEPDYKLCWRINKAFDMNFEREEELQLYHRKRDILQVFSLYHYHDKESLITYRIIKNRSEEGYFLEEIKNIDYLIHIQGEINTSRISGFMLSVAALDPVRMCVPCDLSRIKNKERLLLW
jgi:hypothetical protein